MGRRISRKPASDRVPTRRAPTTHPHDVSSSASLSPFQNVTQPVQQTTQSGNITGSMVASDWSSALGLDQSDIHRAAISSFSAPKCITEASQQTLQKKTPATLMTSFNGVQMYSRGTSAHPVLSSAHSATGLQSILSNIGTSTTGKILLPRPEKTLHYNTSAYSSPSLTEPISRPNQQPPADSTPPPFHPTKCHWRALRDVAFVLDGGINLSPEDLCALLRFRYAKTDPLMARVELDHVGAMYDFCKGWPKELYESTSEKFLKGEMRADLKLMRNGGERVMIEDF